MTAQRGKGNRGPFGKMAGLYLSKGWSPIPVEPNSKRIAVDGWTGHDGEYPTRAQVVEWGQEYHDHNIGIRLPHGVVGIDVDAYREDGGETLARLETELGELPATYVSTSRDDGLSGIRLFAVRDIPKVWKGKAGEGIDVISWHYRYAVCEPSVHPSTERTYRWYLEDEDDSKALGEPLETPPVVEDLPYLPDAWQEYLASEYEGNKTAKLPPNVIKKWLMANGKGSACDVIRATTELWLGEINTASDAGGIHDAAKDGIHAVVGDAMSGHAGMWSELNRLKTAFLAVRADRHDARSPEAESEWRRLIYGEVRIRKGTELAIDDPCTDEYASPEALKSMRARNREGAVVEPDEREIKRIVKSMRLNQQARWQLQTENAADAPRPVNISAFMKMDIPSPRVLIDSLLPLDGNALLVAQRKAGKTTLIHNLIKSMCDRKEFLGAYTINMPKDMKFALLDFEMQQGMLIDWFRKVHISSRGGLAGELFSFRGAASSFNIMSPESRNKWVDILGSANVGYLILDCLAPAMAANGLDENDNSAVAAFLNALDEINRNAGVNGMLMVHHMGHSGERGRGASRLRDWPETEIHLIVDGQGADDDGHLRPRAQRFLAGEGRLGAFDEVGLSFEESDHSLFVSSGNRAEAATEAAIPAVMNYVQQNPGCTKSSVYTNAPGARRVAKEAALRELIDDGSICIHVGGRQGSHNLYDNKVCPDEGAHGIKINVKKR